MKKSQSKEIWQDDEEYWSSDDDVWSSDEESSPLGFFEPISLDVLSHMFVSFLTSQDVARIAPTCRTFAAVAYLPRYANHMWFEYSKQALGEDFVCEYLKTEEKGFEEVNWQEFYQESYINPKITSLCKKIFSARGFCTPKVKWLDKYRGQEREFFRQALDDSIYVHLGYKNSLLGLFECLLSRLFYNNEEYTGTFLDDDFVSLSWCSLYSENILDFIELFILLTPSQEEALFSVLFQSDNFISSCASCFLFHEPSSEYYPNVEMLASDNFIGKSDYHTTYEKHDIKEYQDKWFIVIKKFCERFPERQEELGKRILKHNKEMVFTSLTARGQENTSHRLKSFCSCFPRASVQLLDFYLASDHHKEVMFVTVKRFCHFCSLFPKNVVDIVDAVFDPNSNVKCFGCDTPLQALEVMHESVGVALGDKIAQALLNSNNFISLCVNDSRCFTFFCDKFPQYAADLTQKLNAHPNKPEYRMYTFFREQGLFLESAPCDLECNLVTTVDSKI